MFFRPFKICCPFFVDFIFCFISLTLYAIPILFFFSCSSDVLYYYLLGYHTSLEHSSFLFVLIILFISFHLRYSFIIKLFLTLHHVPKTGLDTLALCSYSWLYFLITVLWDTLLLKFSHLSVFQCNVSQETQLLKHWALN